MAVIHKRIGKKGISYQAIVRIKGYKTICKTFDKKTDAKLWADDIEVQMKKGTYKEHVLKVDENNPINSIEITSNEPDVNSVQSKRIPVKVPLQPLPYCVNTPVVSL